MKNRPNFTGFDILENKKDSIKKVAVIGSGVMGAAIAAHIANSKTDVLLFDIVPNDNKNKDRSVLAKNAIEKLKKTDPAALVHKDRVKYIKAVNLEDNLEELKDTDWVIEAVLENIEIKQNLYAKLEEYLNKNAIISSNTSTIPLHVLVKNMSKNLKTRFFITHFFNPPRYMQLLELVVSKDNKKTHIDKISEFADIKLGKTVVNCKDTPGFIANRIGCFWLTVAMLEAIRMDVTVEEADTVLSSPIGVPKTGVFGLLDLIGIDLMPHIAKSFAATLPKDDWYLKIYKEPKLITQMIKDGYTGRKGKGGFYRLNKLKNKKVKESISLNNGKYSESLKFKSDNIEVAKKSLAEFLDIKNDKTTKYAKNVMLKTLSYATFLVGEISDNIADIDEAMRTGYNFKYGPFELIDKLSSQDKPGTTWLYENLQAENLPISKFLKTIKGKNCYAVNKEKQQVINNKGKFEDKKFEKDKFYLKDLTFSKKPVLKNSSAVLWDIGDGIACLQYKTKMNSVDPQVLELIAKATLKVKEEFKGLVIANDSSNFCVGANIGVLLFAANVAAFKEIRGIIKQGQDTFMGLKFAPFPVVIAPNGMALGGGCEILLHADAVQAHIETYTGLVEVGVGIVPGWGGCKEMILRHLKHENDKRLSVAEKGGMFALSLKQALMGKGSASLFHPVAVMNSMPAISKAFEYISMAKVSKSAEEAADMLILTQKDSISMNLQRLLPDAKAKCLSLVDNYKAPEPSVIKLPGATAKTALTMAVDSFTKRGMVTKHDKIVLDKLTDVLSGKDTDISETITEQELLDLELDAFMDLVKTKGTMDRIEHMLLTGKPLRN